MKLIDKDAVLAIIEKFIYGANIEADIASTGECFDEKVADAKYQLCKCIKGKIDTLEVKEIQEFPVSYKQSPVVLYGLTGSVGNTKEEPQVKESAEIERDKETCKENGDSLTQETVSEVWHDAQTERPQAKEKILATNEYGDCEVDFAINMALYWPKVIKWAYIEDLLNLSNVEQTAKNCKEPVSEDLGEYINELSKQFPDVSFAKLSRIAVRVAKWQKENLWKPADGDNLPEIDREVIVLVQDYPDDKDHLRVAFAHRPSKYAKFWNSTLGEEQVVEIEGYGKGTWNIPNVKYWLDCLMPNMED